MVLPAVLFPRLCDRGSSTTAFDHVPVRGRTVKTRRNALVFFFANTAIVIWACSIMVLLVDAPPFTAATRAHGTHQKEATAQASTISNKTLLLSGTPSKRASTFGWSQRKSTPFDTVERSLISRRAKERPPGGWNPFTQHSQPRGSVRQGKKYHFHLLDRYIRRVDALVPEEMEHLVRPLNYRPSTSTKSLKITIPLLYSKNKSMKCELTEDMVRTFLEPVVALNIVIFKPRKARGRAEAYAHFASSEECRMAKCCDGNILAGETAVVRYTTDVKYYAVMKKMQFARGDYNDTVSIVWPAGKVREEAERMYKVDGARN